MAFRFCLEIYRRWQPKVLHFIIDNGSPVTHKLWQIIAFYQKFSPPKTLEDESNFTTKFSTSWVIYESVTFGKYLIPEFVVVLGDFGQPHYRRFVGFSFYFMAKMASENVEKVVENKILMQFSLEFHKNRRAHSIKRCAATTKRDWNKNAAN